MKPITFVLFLFPTSFIFGQNFYLNINQGFNFPLIISPNVPDEDNLSRENKKHTYMPYVGVGYVVNNFSSVKSGLMYEERGYYGKTFTLDTSNGSTGDLVKTDFYYSFLTIPFIIEIEAGNNIQVYANGGINCSIRIGGATKIDNKNSISLAFIHPEDKSPTWDFSWTSGVGFRVRISDRFKLISEGGFYRSFTPIGTREPIEKEIFHKGYRVSFGVEYYMNKAKK